VEKMSIADSASAISQRWGRHGTVLICVILAACTVGAYWRVGGFDFVEFDDGLYVTENDNVQAGLTRTGLTWAFTTGHAGNWHPLTWLSHMLDCEIFGVNPGRHHLTNLLLHVFNTLLLFWIFKSMTGAVLRSGFVATVFALHPLHVESVAWISERKDVLSTLFLFLTIWAYLCYAKRPRVGWYLLTVVFFALGLLAKPMLVTLPFVLLLLDYWPLERIRFGRSADGSGLARMGFRWGAAVRLVFEKIPFFALSAVSSVVTFRVQQAGNAVQQLEIFSVQARVINALLSYLRYIGKMFWPSGLCIYYPHPGDKLLLWHGVVAGLVLAVVSVLVVWQLRRRKYLFVGWFWYVGMLLPVIGLVQVGGQAMADRYTYVPMVGLSIMIAWGVWELLAKWKFAIATLAASMLAIVAVLTVCTWRQTGYWREGKALFVRAVSVTENNEKMHIALSKILFEEGRAADAIMYLAKALAVDSGGAGDALSKILNQPGGIDKGFADGFMAVNPAAAKGRALVDEGKVEEAIKLYREILEDKPDDVSIRYELAVLLDKRGRTDEAIVEYEHLLEFAPNHPAARSKLEAALKR